MKKRIMLLAHDRSGSNLMRALISAHSQVYLCPPLPIFENLQPLIAHYGSLDEDKNLKFLIKHIVKLANANHHPLPYQLTEDELFSRACTAERTLGQICQIYFDAQASYLAKPVSGIKSGVQPHKLKEFLESTNNSHIIFLYRDPRDVVISSIQAARHNLSAEMIIQAWIKWHANAMNLLSNYNFYCVKYEDLMQNTKETLRNTFSFLDLPYEDTDDVYYKQQSIQQIARTSYMWENVSKPLMKGQVSKFYSSYNYHDIEKLEALLGKNLEMFGYSKASRELFSSLDSRPTPRQLSSKDKSLTSNMSNALIEIQKELEANII